MWSCKLQTTPEEKTIPEHQQDGIIHIDNNNHIHWISKGHTRSPVSIPLQTVKRMQESKSSSKVRLVLENTTFYVIDIPLQEQRQFFVSAVQEYQQLHKDKVIDLTTTSSFGSTASGSSSTIAPTTSTNTPSSSSSSSTTATSSSSSTAASTSSNNVLFTEHELDGLNIDLQQIKKELLVHDTDLCHKYAELVSNKIITDQTFWSSNRVKRLLMDYIMTKLPKKIGLSNVMLDDITSSKTDKGITKFKVDAAFKETLFATAPLLKIAFITYIPTPLAERDFWQYYFQATEFRKQHNIDDNSNNKDANPHNSSSVSNSFTINQAKPKLRAQDIKSLKPEQFFDMFQRGEIHLIERSNRLIASSTTNDSTDNKSRTDSSNIHNRQRLANIDSGNDLISTVEDNLRTRRLMGDTSTRAGYGIDHQNEFEGATEQMVELRHPSSIRNNSHRNYEMEQILRKKNDAQQVITSLNDHGKSVIDSTQPKGHAVGNDTTTTTTNKNNTDRNNKHSIENSTDSNLTMNNITSDTVRTSISSTADDLPDLYSRAALLPSYVELKADFQKLREALRTQGTHDEASVDSSTISSTSLSSLNNGNTVNGTMSLSGSGGNGGGGGGGGGWSIVEDNVSSSNVTSSSGGGGWDIVEDNENSSFAKPRTLTSTTSTNISSSSSSVKVSSIAKRPLTETYSDETILSSIPSNKQLLDQMHKQKTSRLTLLQVVRQAHDIFASETRNRAGFSAKVPSVWEYYIVYRYRLNNELLMHMWNMLNNRTTTTTGSNAYERIQRLYSEIEKQYEEIEKLKQLVTKKGIRNVQPPLPTNVTLPSNTVNSSSSNETDDNEAQSEIIKLLMLLQRYMEPTLAASLPYKKK